MKAVMVSAILASSCAVALPELACAEVAGLHLTRSESAASAPKLRVWFARIGSGAMLPSLGVGKNVVARPYAPGEAPRRGDVLFIAGQGGTHLVFRLIGLPGDAIKLSQSNVFINGKMLSRTGAMPAKVELGDGRTLDATRYTESVEGGSSYDILVTEGETGALSNFDEVTVPDGAYFVMGGNQDFSSDSRVSATWGGLGFVPRADVVGHVGGLQP